MKKFKNDTKGKSNKVLRAKEGDFLQGVSDLSDVAGRAYEYSPFPYLKYLDPTRRLFMAGSAGLELAGEAGKKLYKEFSPSGERSSLEEKAFNDLTKKMASGDKRPKDVLNKTPVLAPTVAPTVATLPMVSSPKAVNRVGSKPIPNKVPALVSGLPYGPNKSQRLLDSYLDQDINSTNVYDPTMSSSPIKNNSSQQLNSYLNKAMESAATTKPSSAAPDMAKAAGELPKTKSGMKKFMDEYGKFIALGALSGFGGKAGVAAGVAGAALPGILKALQNRGKKTPGTPAGTTAGTPVPGASIPVAHGGLLSNKSAAHPKKKMAGGTVRKFKGGSMNTMKENIVPQYKKGGNMPKGMPKEMMAMMGKKYKHGGEMSKGMSQGMMDMMGKKGKATGDMPEHKKMDMGMPIGKMPDSKKMGMAKPKPSSMNQKFAKGGTAKYASGGMCKGYGIAKKIRSTGVMN